MSSPIPCSATRQSSFHLLLFEELKLLELLAERDGPNASDYLRKLIRMVPSTNSPTVAQVTRLGRRSEA